MVQFNLSQMSNEIYLRDRLLQWERERLRNTFRLTERDKTNKTRCLVSILEYTTILFPEKCLDGKVTQLMGNMLQQGHSYYKKSEYAH